jgi:hypothetical protein
MTTDTSIADDAAQLERQEQATDRQRVLQLRRERDEWRDALQHLTPLGSEFTTPRECVEWVREHMNHPRLIIQANSRIRELETQGVQRAADILRALLSATEHEDIAVLQDAMSQARAWLKGAK